MKIPIKGNGNGGRRSDNFDFDTGSSNLIEKQRMFLNSESLLKYFLGTDEHIDTLITCKGSQFNLTTYDYNLYEALGSLKPYDNFQPNKLVKLFEVVKVLPYEDYTGRSKHILTHERVDELRKKALSSNTD